MIRSLLAVALIAAAPVIAQANGLTYSLDPGHTEVRFVWDHAGVSEQGARWDKVTGTVSFDPNDIAATKIDVTIDPSSVNSGVDGLNKHMISGDMFDVAKFPEITFTSTSAEKTGDKTARITGDLTIKNVTLPLELEVELVHMGPHPIGQYLDYYKGEWLGIRATGKLIRSEFGVGYGAPSTSDAIRLEISAEMKSG